MQQEVDIYTYSLSIINLCIKIKFPCKIYLEHDGSPLTSEIAASSPNKFIYNQEVTLTNSTDKEYIEVLLQLVTDKGAKYVGGVLKLLESELIASQGERIELPVHKCLDAEATCEVRVDQVTSSKVTKKIPPRRKNLLKSQYHGEGAPKITVAHQNETKSEYNFPLTINRSREQFQMKRREPTLGGTALKKMGYQIQREGSTAGMSALQFEVYKQGYNKLKDKYRKQAQNARAELNKRMALQSSQNTLKLQVMRYKMKVQQLQKTVSDKNMKIKEYTQNISVMQKKQLDTKYLKQEVQNKNHTIKHLEDTNRTLLKDNNDLKNMQTNRLQNEQQTVRTLKEECEKIRKEAENRQNELMREIKNKNDAISKIEYQLHIRTDQIQRLKCDIEDLEKNINNKTFEWEKLQQNQRNNNQNKINSQKEHNSKLLKDKTDLQTKIKQLMTEIEGKRTEIVKADYDKKVLTQTNQTLLRENQELKVIREKYLDLVRDHKIVSEQKNVSEKNRERESRLKQAQIQDLNVRLSNLNQNTKKTIRDLEEKNKTLQLRSMEAESQNELLKNQLEKAKRQYELASKQMAEQKTYLKELKNESKDKEEKLLNLTNELADIKNRSKQGDYSSRLETERLRQEVEKTSKLLEEEKHKNNTLSQNINKMEVESNKNRMEWQFREEKVQKELGYAKQKINSLETLKADLQFQIGAAATTNSNLKNNEKTQAEKIQKLEMEALHLKEDVERQKKESRLLEEKLVHSQNSIKGKLKEIAEQQTAKEVVQKKMSKLQGQLTETKNELNKEKNDKNKNQKMVQILQADIAKAREEHKRLNDVIATREKSQDELREQLKKQKEEYTKLDMKLATIKKQYEKFKDNIIQTIHAVFTAIPEGLEIANQRSRVVQKTDKPLQNNEIMSLLSSLGRQTRSNMARLVDQLKAIQRDHQKLNNDLESNIDKCNTSEFEYSQAIARLEDEIAEMLKDKQKLQNKYEEEVFLLEGRIRQKQAIIAEQLQQIQQLDFSFKNSKVEFEGFQEDTAKKEHTRGKIINELREQIEYHLTTISLLQNSIEKAQEEIQENQTDIQEKSVKIGKLERELIEMTERQLQTDQEISNYRRDIKKLNQTNEELSFDLKTQKEEVARLQHQLEEEERKAAELRQFLSTLMKQKEEIIKKELEKSEQILEHETKIEENKNQTDRLNEQIKKLKKQEEELKQNIKKLIKQLNEEETTLSQEKQKTSKLADKLRQKEKEMIAKDEIISKLEEKIKREREKSGKENKELETELDQVYLKLLNKEKESNEKIITLESDLQKSQSECQKLKEELSAVQEELFIEKSNKKEVKESAEELSKEINDHLLNRQQMQTKIKEQIEEITAREEENFKLQGKILSLENQLEMSENQKVDRLEDLQVEWGSKYENMVEEYENRLELIEKEKEFVKARLEEKQKEYRKVVNEQKQQQNNVILLKKTFEDKIKSLENDRLALFSQKNSETQRLVDQNRTNFENMKVKEAECRKLNTELQLLKNTLNKTEIKVKQNEQKIQNINKTFLSEVEEMKKKDQNYKKVKQNLATSLWKSEREVRRVLQVAVKQMLGVIDSQSTPKVVEITKTLQQNVLGAISIKIDQ